VVQPGPSQVGLVNWEELDDEHVIVDPTRLACKLVILQQNARICLAFVLDDIARCVKIFWETCVMHVVSKCLCSRFLRNEATPLSVVMSTTARVLHVVLGLSVLIPLMGLTACQGSQTHVWMTQPDTG
jgi:hypothetical protein